MRGGGGTEKKKQEQDIGSAEEKVEQYPAGL
jgi:hypothetical protein